jgi:hypothetical protein
MRPMAGSSFGFRANEQCGTGQHHPHRVYCPRPETCCGWDDLGLLCCVDKQEWPCDVKRAHVAARVGVHTGQPPGAPTASTPDEVGDRKPITETAAAGV